MSCLITGGAGINCNALRRVGGVKKRAYVFNHSELVSVNYDSDGYIDKLNFDAYKGLYNFKSRKSAHSGGVTAQISGAGGNKFFQHDVILKMFPDDPTEDQIMEEILVGCVGIILEDNNGEFKLYGLENGLDQTEGGENTGQEQNADVAYSLTFAGMEQLRPKRILIDNDTLATKNYLDTLVV